MMDRIGIIGAGKMGEAILSGLIKAGRPAEAITFSEVVQERASYIENRYGVRRSDVQTLFRDCNIVIIAVKPQDIDTAIGGMDASKNLIISIAAGVSSERIGSILKNAKRVVRVMPNLPLVVGEGMIAIFRGTFSQEEDVEFTQKLFSSMGETVILDEKYADAVTAMSGSGPGFMGVIMEAMEDAGVLLGLPREVSRVLSVQTALGSSALLKKKKISPFELKCQVASPGGTTISGILEMESKGIRGTIMSSIKKAFERSKELS